MMLRKKKHKPKPTTPLGKAWYFIWEDNSPLSWLANVVLAFVLIKFIVYPGLGFILGTSHPVVAVVSGSMEHNEPFDTWWDKRAVKYAEFNISKEQFEQYALKNGFRRGDIIVLLGSEPKSIKVGDIIVFRASQREPIIHRTVITWREKDNYFYSTRGDNNKAHVPSELRIHEDQVIGKAWIKLPLLGYVKIIFTGLLDLIAS